MGKSGWDKTGRGVGLPGRPASSVWPLGPCRAGFHGPWLVLGEEEQLSFDLEDAVYV